MNLPSNASDGYKNWVQLYEHRNLMLIKLMQDNYLKSWYSVAEYDGTIIDGWFFGGIRTPNGELKFHLPSDMWDLALQTRAERLERARRTPKQNPYIMIKLIHDWIRTDKQAGTYNQTYSDEVQANKFFDQQVQAKSRSRPS